MIGVFDNLKDMASLAGLMKDLPRLQEKMSQMRERLGRVIVEGETGGGAVRVRANARLQVLAIEVDPALIAGLVDARSAEDRSMAEELMTGAVNAALEKARQAAERELREGAAEMGLPLPPGLGLDLNL